MTERSRHVPASEFIAKKREERAQHAKKLKQRLFFSKAPKSQRFDDLHMAFNDFGGRGLFTKDNYSR